MTGRVRTFVRLRANDRCEYCRIRECDDAYRPHLDHILPKKHGGSDNAENLALACSNCSLGKGSNLAGRDPDTGKIARLFHPRKDNWSDHFRWSGARLSGTTAVGRVTVLVMNINNPDRIAIRRALIDEGTFPDED